MSQTAGQKASPKRLFRAKLKHVLWLRDLKASLINCPEKNIHETSSSRYVLLKYLKHDFSMEQQIDYGFD